MIATTFAQDLFDGGMKSILGQSATFNATDVIKLTATRPETASRLCKKLWEWYGYTDPEPKVVDKLAATFKSGDYHLKPVLKEIATMPEFWGPKCVRQKVKSPADFIVGILRQFELNTFLHTLRPANTTPMTPMHPILRGTAGLLWGSMYQQGLQLLFPPDVSGWRWGTAWLSSANMAERMKFSATIFNVGAKDKGLAGYFGNKIKTEHKPMNDTDLVEALCQTFDIDFAATKKSVLVKACNEAGGVSSLATPEGSSKVCHAVCRLIFSSPEFQVC
jgi:uncharacterized protein (DUF1800 family)